MLDITTAIQRADFFFDKGGPVTPELALRLFEQHDWTSELALQKQLESESKEWCPPNMIFYSGDKALQVCLQDEQTGWFVYSYKERYLSFLPIQKQLWRASASMSRMKLSEAIKKFVAGEHSWLLRKTKEWS